jgi:protein AaeX
VFGVLISPIVPLIVVAFAITMVLRWAAVEFGWVRRIWHPALFEFSIFLIVLTATVLTFGMLRIYN